LEPTTTVSPPAAGFWSGSEEPLSDEEEDEQPASAVVAAAARATAAVMARLRLFPVTVTFANLGSVRRTGGTSGHVRKQREPRTSA
jgi:hypothetical protein